MSTKYSKCMTAYKYIFNENLLKNKVAFVTGGGSGIGFTIAEVLMRHQCKTVIASRNLERLTKAAAELESKTNQKCLPVQMDVRKPDQVAAGVKTALSEFKRIDFLVNGAAGNFLCPAAGLSPNAFRTVIEIDLIGTFNVTREVYHQYLREHGGNIVNITATLDYKGQAMMSHAGSAKAGIDALTRHWAVEWGPDNIRINSIAPGPIKGTEGFDKLGGNFIPEDHMKAIPLQRPGEKVEIANATLFLLSDAASYVTGTVLVADGGDWMGTSNSFHMMQKLMQAALGTQNRIAQKLNVTKN